MHRERERETHTHTYTHVHARTHTHTRWHSFAWITARTMSDGLRERSSRVRDFQIMTASSSSPSVYDVGMDAASDGWSVRCMPAMATTVAGLFFSATVIPLACTALTTTGTTSPTLRVLSYNRSNGSVKTSESRQKKRQENEPAHSKFEHQPARTHQATTIAHRITP